MDWSEYEARDGSLAAAHAAMVASGMVVPVECGADDERSWTDYDLASFAENRLGERCDPDELNGRTRDRWLDAALSAEELLPTPTQRESEACYWLLRDGHRAGTLAIARYCLGQFVRAHSVYLQPRHQGQGIMAQALRAVHAELEARDLGLRLETGWTWQRAVRFYLRAGFWLRSWKRDLAFIRPPRTPPPVVAVGEAQASVGADVAGRRIVLAWARRAGNRLVEHGEESEVPEDARYLIPDALTTLALAIALKGWPLIRSQSHWERCRTSDLVHPEALAERIQVWEAWSLRHGWRVETPRIPGLEYPTWAILESS